MVRAGVAAPGLPVADGAADVVIMSELIEHLVDPDGAVAEARRVLRPGGSLLLSTPNLAAWYNRGLLAAGIQPVFSEVSLRGVFGRPGRVVAGHLRLFTRRALTGVPGRERLPLRDGGRGALPRRAAAAGLARPGLLPVAGGRVHPAGARPEGMIPPMAQASGTSNRRGQAPGPPQAQARRSSWPAWPSGSSPGWASRWPGWSRRGATRPARPR